MTQMIWIPLSAHNDPINVKWHALMPKKPLKLLAIGLLVLIVFIGVWYWRQCRSYESNNIAETSWLETGKPMVAVVTVSDQNGAPLAGVYVVVMNDSGGNGETTDAKGVATIQLGEGEFNGLNLNSIPVVSRPHSGSLPWSPSVSNGMQIKVVVKDKAAIGVP